MFVIVKFSPTPGKKLNVTLKCDATNGVYIEVRSAHKKLGEVQCLNINFSYKLSEQSSIIFYFIDI